MVSASVSAISPMGMARVSDSPPTIRMAASLARPFRRRRRRVNSGQAEMAMMAAQVSAPRKGWITLMQDRMSRPITAMRNTAITLMLGKGLGVMRKSGV